MGTIGYLTNGMVQYSAATSRKEARAKALELRRRNIYSVVFPVAGGYSAWVPSSHKFLKLEN